MTLLKWVWFTNYWLQIFTSFIRQRLNLRSVPNNLLPSLISFQLNFLALFWYKIVVTKISSTIMFIKFEISWKLIKFPLRHKWNEVWLLIINWYIWATIDLIRKKQRFTTAYTSLKRIKKLQSIWASKCKLICKHFFFFWVVTLKTSKDRDKGSRLYLRMHTLCTNNHMF